MTAILFHHTTHEHFFNKMLGKCKRKTDVYYRALFYLLGTKKETRNHINDIFDFEGDSIKPEVLFAPWQTESSLQVTLLAFNLWNGWIDDDAVKGYSPYELFNCWLAPYFIQAIKLRFPEYCEPK